jgi:hypothetical protein
MTRGSIPALAPEVAMLRRRRNVPVLPRTSSVHAWNGGRGSVPVVVVVMVAIVVAGVSTADQNQAGVAA